MPRHNNTVVKRRDTLSRAPCYTHGLHTRFSPTLSNGCEYKERADPVGHGSERIFLEPGAGSHGWLPKCSGPRRSRGSKLYTSPGPPRVKIMGKVVKDLTKLWAFEVHRQAPPPPSTASRYLTHLFRSNGVVGFCWSLLWAVPPVTPHVSLSFSCTPSSARTIGRVGTTILSMTSLLAFSRPDRTGEYRRKPPASVPCPWRRVPGERRRCSGGNTGVGPVQCWV